MLGAMALEGGESFGEGRKTVGVVLGVAGGMVAGVLHSGSVALIFGVLLDPEALELMSLD
jgi:hypothetical protein